MAPLTLQSFEFDVVTVNAQGQETSRTQGQAQSFTEDLGQRGWTGHGVQSRWEFRDRGSSSRSSSSGAERTTAHSHATPPLLISKYPVTYAQWQAVASLPQSSRELTLEPSHFKGAKRPVEQVSWYDAVEFCKRLAQHTGRQYRLPSEAEWEYACRADTTTPFHYGATIITDLANYRGIDFNHQGWTIPGFYGQGPRGEYREQTTEVGSFPPNAFGLYDMHGNVQEWCRDHWHDDYQGAPDDGSAWIAGGKSYLRLVRGGAWVSYPTNCRSGFRIGIEPFCHGYYIGFRVVCAAP